MKVIVALALVQIVGFLSSAMAQETISEVNANLELIHEFRSAISVFNFRREEYHYTDIPESAKIKCEMNGGPNAYNTSVESLLNFFDPATDLTNTTQIRLEAAENELHNGPKSAIETGCHWIMSMADLIRTLMKSFKPCWSPAERNSIELINNVSTSVLQYICQNKGNRISAFIAADGIRCVNKMSTAIDKCYTRNDLDIVNVLVSELYYVILPWSFPIFSLNTEYCPKFQNFQRCAVAELQKCEHSTPANGIKYLFDIVMESLGCAPFLGAQTSPAINMN